MLFCSGAGNAQQSFQDISTVQPDLIVPPMTEEKAAPGKRVKIVPPEYAKTDIYHALYLPTDWEPGKKYPVIVEYAGNGPYKNKFGDVCTGRVEDCNLGFGVGGGSEFIWVCLPYISENKTENQLWWWGDVGATVEYCKTEVDRICTDYGGDPTKIFITGFSRGSIACNYIGLHDDEIAKLWCGFICHSHYDGLPNRNYPGINAAGAAMRQVRLGARPQFISGERSVKNVKDYLKDKPGNFTFQAIPFRNHTDGWVLRDIPEREKLRAWVRKTIDQIEE